MSNFLKKYTCSNKLLINHKISLIQKQLKDLKELLTNNPDEDYFREYSIVFNALISLENIRLYKLIDKNSSSYIKPTGKN